MENPDAEYFVIYFLKRNIFPKYLNIKLCILWNIEGEFYVPAQISVSCAERCD